MLDLPGTLASCIKVGLGEGNSKDEDGAAVAAAAGEASACVAPFGHFHIVMRDFTFDADTARGAAWRT